MQVYAVHYLNSSIQFNLARAFYCVPWEVDIG